MNSASSSAKRKYKKKNHSGPKDTITEIKNIIRGRISNLEDRLVEITQLEEQEERII